MLLLRTKGGTQPQSHVPPMPPNISTRDTTPRESAKLRIYQVVAGQKPAFPGHVLPKLGSARQHGVFFKRLNPQTRRERPGRGEQCPTATQGSGHTAVIQPSPSAPSARKHSAERAGKAFLSAKPPKKDKQINKSLRVWFGPILRLP